MSDTVYPYDDEAGVVQYEVIRSPGKAFKQRRPDGNGNYINNVKGVERLPYRLPELIQGVEAGETLFIVEGEKDTDRLRSLGLCATTTSGGATTSPEAVRNKLPPRLISILQLSHQIVVIGDNDPAGDVYARTIADLAVTVCPDVRIISPIPGSLPKGDISDWLDEGHTLEEFYALIDASPQYVRQPEVSIDESTTSLDALPEKSEHGYAVKPSQGTLLIDILEELGIDLFHDDAGDCYASYTRNDHQETCSLDSRQFKDHCRHAFYLITGKSISAPALADALGVISAKAKFDGPERRVAMRCERVDDVVYIDMTNDDWEIVEVTADGFRIVPAADCPVRFKRYRGMLPLPMPLSGGTLQQLDQYLPTDPDARALIKAWLTAALYSGIPQPVLNITGPQGSGKSSVAEWIRALVDPNNSPLRATLHDRRDIGAAARNNYCCVFDNVSKLQPWISDALCLLATGGGFAGRELYTNADEYVVEATRPVILTGIYNVIYRGDLADRTIDIQLDLMDDHTRKTEGEMKAAFKADCPFIFGSLLNALSVALKFMPTTDRSRLGRMADFELLGRAASSALGLSGPQAFAELYRVARTITSWGIADASPLTEELRKLVSGHEVWTGKFQELFDRIVPDFRHRRAGDWPSSPRGLSSDITRLIPNLRSIGIEVLFSEPDRERGRTVTIKRLMPAFTDETSTTSAREGQHVTADVYADPSNSAFDISASTTPVFAGVADVADVADVDRDVQSW